MNFCQECGHKLEEDLQFCTNCGHKVPAPLTSETSASNEPPVVATTKQPKEQPPTRSKKAINKKANPKTKSFAIIAIILLAIGLGAHFFLQNHFDPAKKISAMNDAYYKKDKQALLDSFTVPADTVVDKDIFHELISDYGWKEVQRDLNKEVSKLNNGRTSTVVMDPDQYHDFILLEKKEILFGLYHDIEFTLIPIAANVILPLKDMTFTINDTEFMSVKEEEEIFLGNFIPGTYDWSFSVNEEEILPLKNKGTYEIYGDEDNHAVLDIDWGITDIYIDSAVADATLYINGKSSKKKINEISPLSPAIVNPEIEVHAVTKNDKGKEIKSQKVPLDQTDIYIPFEHIEKEEAAQEVEELIRNTYEDFRNRYEDAIYLIDFSYIEDFFKSGSKIEDDYDTFVSDHADLGYYYYDFLKNKIVSFKALKNDKYEVITEETFDFGSDSDGDIHYERSKKYIFFIENEHVYIEEITNLDTKKTKI